ncbi:lysophospholipid acyltransferase family protein [Edaphocola aurantiacus]|uniref:hypothetical protein n=1 Tax=Edaphocola aurantiacus TaxID=2601682 RepID=UPI001C98D48A|nr:hypothetical protein [Edaphocola aurantiacus]
MNLYNEALTKATLKRFFREDHESIYERYQDYLLFNNEHCLKEHDFENVFTLNSQLGNRLYFSFHFGPFLYILYHLIKRMEIDVIFIASQHSRDRVEHFIEFSKTVDLKFNENTVIYADSYTGFRQIVEAMKSGKALFSLIDIGSGSNAIDKSNNVKEIELLHETMLVRNSLFEIAAKLKYPITQGLGYWKDGKRHIELKDIEPEQFSMAAVWKDFEKMLVQYPEQWESYHTIYKFMKPSLPGDTDHIAREQDYTFCKDRYDILKDKDNKYLFTQEYFSFFKISDRTTEIIEYCETNNLTFKLDEIEELFEHNGFVTDLIKYKIIGTC